MKKITYLLIFAAGLLLTGCYDLDTYPEDQVSKSQFWKTEDHVKQALMGAYSAMREDQAFGLYFMFDNMGEIAYGFDSQAYEQAFSGNYTARTGFVKDKWKAYYEGVKRANELIANISLMNALDAGKKTVYIAEAKFLRALFYFALLDLYGGVPYYDETTDVNVEYANMLKPRSSAEEIRSYVLKDLDDAIAGMKIPGESEYGRANKGAAYALRGKVYLYNKEWKNAIADFEEIVYNKTGQYGYRLHPNYKDLFEQYNGKKNNEMIFSVQNKGGAGNNYGMKLAFYLGTRSTYGSCWNNSVPSKELVDMYEYPDGKPFNWDDIYPGYSTATPEQRKEWLAIKLSSTGIESLLNADTAKILNAHKKRDPRLMATIIAPYSTYLGWRSNTATQMMFVLHNAANGGGSPHENNGFIRNNKTEWTTYYWRKFVPEANLGGALTNREHTPFEFPLIRYADVLLMLSEAYNEDSQLEKAIAELNKVRTRAKMPELNNGADWLSVTSKEEMTLRIRKERAVELACEGHRFSDLRRWGVALTMLPERPCPDIYGGPQYKHKFTERDMLWPIPGEEIERNDLITQNPGWD